MACGETFLSLFFQAARKKLPKLSKEEALAWAVAEDYAEHDLGVRVLLRDYLNHVESWETFLHAFQQRHAEDITPYLIYALAHIPWHGDIAAFGFERQIISPELRQRWSHQGTEAILKLLCFVNEDGFERGTVGQNVAALTFAIEDYEAKLKKLSAEAELENLERWALQTLLNNRCDIPV